MRLLSRIVQLWMVVCLCFAVRANVVNAQCASHPSRETTVSVINVSSWPIAFSIDGVTRATVLPAELSVDFKVSPGQHTLLAETSIEGEDFSVSRKLVVPAGSMCVWTITNQLKDSRRPRPPFIDPLMRVAVIPVAIPNGM